MRGAGSSRENSYTPSPGASTTADWADWISATSNAKRAREAARSDGFLLSYGSRPVDRYRINELKHSVSEERLEQVREIDGEQAYEQGKAGAIMKTSKVGGTQYFEGNDRSSSRMWLRLRRVVPLVAGSLAAGAAGCFFLQWSQGRETEYVGTLVAFLAIAVTVFGWYKTTGLQATEQKRLHELQVAAQREFIHLKLLNEARHEIRRVLMQEGDRLGECSMGIHALLFSDPIASELRAKVARTLLWATTHRSATDWIFVFEENAALFPEVRFARLQLVQRQNKMHDEFRGYANLLASVEPLPRQFDARAKDLWDNITDQSALLGDLRIHVQNRALDPVSGHATPARQPPDDRVPRLIMDDGDLVISVPDAARRVQMEGENWLPPRNPPGAYSP